MGKIFTHLLSTFVASVIVKQNSNKVMEEKVRIARKALLEGVKPMTFRCEVGYYGGGACGEDYCTESEFEISRDELMYVLNSRIGFNEVFEDVPMMIFDVDSELSDLAYDCSWPEGDPIIAVLDSVPIELQDLVDRINNVDPDDEEEYEDLRSELENLSDGSYTFRINVTDASFSYMFAEEEEYEVRLTAAEARGMVYAQVVEDELFSGLKCNCISESDIEEKLEKLNVAAEFDNLSYSGSSNELDAYVDAWKELISLILRGDISEEQLPEWLAYFDDFRENGDCGIEDWHSAQ